MALQTYGMNEDTYIRNVLMPIMKEYDIITMFQLQYLSKNNVNSKDLAKSKQVMKQYVDGLISKSKVQRYDR